VKIGRQLTEGLRHHHRMRGREARATAVALLRSVGLPSPERRLSEYPHHLSGGMRQRVTVALALACGPKLLIADEPTTALDVTVQRQILDLLADQQRERYMAMILVTHDLGVVANRTDEIAVMYAGQVVERAPTETLFRRMRHPYTQALMGSIPRLENPSHTPLRAIPGRPPDMVDLPPGCRFAPRCPYAQARCHTEEPPLVEAGEEGHVHRCFYPLGTTPVSVAPPAPRSAAGSGSVSDSASGSGSVSDSASGSGSVSNSVSEPASGPGSDSASGPTSPADASRAEGHRGGAGGDGTARSTQEIAG
jgi:peptide/nickel transport system ATP-binding protein